jgi:GT2 family glycosyltransferase
MSDCHISASIVLYKNDITILNKTIMSILNCKRDRSIVLYLVDNSPTDELKSFLFESTNIKYIHNPSNPGFGSAHNLAIKEAIQVGSIYHFIVNPDIYFDGDVIGKMIQQMKLDSSIGMLMPRVLNPDGSLQYLPKLLPSPWHIVWRKLKWPSQAFQRFIDWYELRNVSPNLTLNVPVLSGCFTLLNLEAVKKIGLYDDMFFMYFEDWDLSRRMHKKYKTLYFPEVSVYHEYCSGANHNTKLFRIFLRSAIYYFSKWGWFIDKDRNEVNKRVIDQLV